MLGDIRARLRRREVNHLMATHTEDLRVRQTLPASSAHRRDVGDRVIGIIDQTQRGAGGTGLLTPRLTRTRTYGALGGRLLGERRIRRRWFAAVGGIPTELGMQRRDQAFELRHPRQQRRDLGVFGGQQRHDVVVRFPAGHHDQNIVDHRWRSPPTRRRPVTQAEQLPTQMSMSSLVSCPVCCLGRAEVLGRMILWYGAGSPAGGFINWPVGMYRLQGKWFIYVDAARRNPPNFTDRLYALEADTDDPMGGWTLKGRVGQDTWTIGFCPFVWQGRLY